MLGLYNVAMLVLYIVLYNDSAVNDWRLYLMSFITNSLYTNSNEYTHLDSFKKHISQIM